MGQCEGSEMKKIYAVLVLLSGLVVLVRFAHAQLPASSRQESTVSPPISNRGATSAVNRDTQATRPDQWADIRQFGAYAKYSTTTATATSGRPTVALASAQSFKNGEYVTVYNAGPRDCTNAMGTVTLTPSLNAGGFNTVPARTGSSSFSYKVIAAGKFGCYTPASAGVTTSRGNAIGKQSVTISTMARSGQTVTVTTSSAHPFVVGSQVFIPYFGGNADITFNGFFIVLTVPDSTHFTFKQNLDTAGGATTFDIGGTAIGFTINHLTWSVVTGAWKYYVYGRSGGSYNLLGVTMEPFFDDYGSPMNDNRAFPPFIPTTAPASGANNHLTAQIRSGGGTTALTLASNAGASLSGVGVVSDDGPAISGVTHTGGYTVYIPPSGAIVNSYTQLNTGAGQNRHFLLDGFITLNDTLETDSGIFEGWGTYAPSAFAWEGSQGFGGSLAYPMLALTGSTVFKNLSVFCYASNGCLNMWDVGSTNDSFDYVSFATGNGNTTDYLGQHAIFGYGSFSYRWDKCLFITGSPGANSQASIGNSPIPSLIFKESAYDRSNAPTGNFSITRSWFVLRGSIETDVPSKSGGMDYVLLDDIQTQSSYLPLLMYTGASNSGAISWSLQNITPADYPTAMIANLSSADSIVSNVFLVNSTAPNEGGLFFTGAPFSNTFLHNANQVGLNRDLANPAVGAFPNLAVTTNNTGVMGYSLPIPAAGRTAASSGGGVPVGTHTYRLTWQDAFGNTTSVGLGASITVTSGNQIVTVTPPKAPAGAVGVQYYRDGALHGPSSGNCGPFSVTTVLVDTLPFSACGNSVPTISKALAGGIASAGATAPSVILTGGGFTNRESGTFTANRERTVQDANGTESLTIASGSARLGTSSISPNGCATAVAMTAKGVLPTDTLIVTPTAPPAAHYASLTLSNSYTTSGSVTILVCNPTSESLTPGAAIVNWRVVR
jgi:hypothetical protein